MAPQHDPVHRAASLFPTSVTSRSYGRRRRIRRAVTAGVVLVALAGGGIAVAQTTGKTPTSYRTAVVGQHDVSATIDGVATIQPVAQADVAFPLAGTVATVDVKVGDTVTAGQALATLDTSALLVNVRAEEAALDKAKLVLAEALDGKDVSSLTGGSFGSSYVLSDAAVERALAALPATVAAVDDGGLSAAQHAVLNGQQAVDAAIAEAGTALDSATQVCSAIGVDPTSTDPGTINSAVNACQTALNTVVTKQAAVRTAQNTLATASTNLDDLLAQLAQVVTTPTTTPTTATTIPTTTAPTTTEPSPATPTTTEPSATTSTTSPSASSTTVATPSTINQPATATGSGSNSNGGPDGTSTDSSTSSVPDSASGRTGASSGGGGGSTGSSSRSVGGTTAKTPTAADLIAYQKAVDSAQSALAVAYLTVGQATIASPVGGQVISVGVAAGDSVTAASTTQQIVVQGNGGYEATTTVSLAKVADVKVGATATVLPDGTSTTYSGKVVSVALVPTTSSSGTTSFGVAIALDGDTSALHNGGIGSVSVVTGATAAALTVPTSAVTTEGALHAVTVIDGSTPTSVAVQVGVVGPVWTEITSGLTAGQQVVLATLNKPLPSSATSATNATTTQRRVGAGGFNPGAARG
ncbi:MAG: efflux transporter periplasmic adaptor subunit [Ilumatobacteraceae bacterium]|nr:efflux transporter periplasmic adaptor subunit [Ilumatobacteraceae bacterium]